MASLAKLTKHWREINTDTWGFPGAQMVKGLSAMQETQIWSLGWEDPLEKGMATHCSTLAWRIRGQRSLAGCSLGSRKESGVTEN